MVSCKTADVNIFNAIFFQELFQITSFACIKAISSFEAKEVIAKGSGKEFDPKVVKAFLSAFGRGKMEVPEVML